MRAMKRNISLVLVMAILFTGFAGLAEESGVPIDVEHFPDAAFRSFIREQDEDKNDYLDQDEIKGITDITLQNRGLQNIRGVEYLTSLTSLDVSNDVVFKAERLQ